ncbi:MAG: prolyl oligopeptidase family serine peptidase [Gemmatimonadota bacterium]|nr:prolyl oligopeptidase family serine peptidase [Gemmatimonadota bacterium]
MKVKQTPKRAASALFVLLFPAAAFAQEPRPLPIEDYDRWRSIESVALSPDGEWLTFAYGHRVIEDTLQVRHLDDRRVHELPGAANPRFSDDSRWLVARAERTAYLLDLASGASRSWEEVDAVVFAAGSGHLAVKKRPPQADDGEVDHRGTDLILVDLAGGSSLVLGNVDLFAFDAAGSALAYTVDSEGASGNGVYLLRLATARLETLHQAPRTYSRLTWNETGTGVAALAGSVPEGMTERENTLVAVRGIDGEPTVTEFAGDGPGVPDGFVLSERGPLRWRGDGAGVFVGIKPQREELVDDPDNPRPNVDVFHWNDDDIQTVQRARAERDRNFTLLAAVDLEAGRLVRLADETLRTIDLTDDGRWGVGRDGRAYVSDWKEARADYYRVDTRTGERTPIVKAQMRTLGISPGGTHFAFWREGDLWVYEIETDRTINLTADAPVSFVNEEYDRPGTKPPYGIAGWTGDGTGLVLNHRYDLWLQPLDGAPARSLTGGAGDRDETRFRVLRLDEAPTIDFDAPVLLSAYGEWTKRSGFFVLEDGRLTEQVYADREYDDLIKASDADRYVFTASTFAEFDDLWVSDGSFGDAERVTDANPQQAEYRWGERILFDFENKDGVRLQGTLAIPDAHTQGERLPMIVNFYEKKSQEMHSYYAPRFESGYPSGNAGPVAEFGAYVSNGYLVMQLDVHFNTGTTHSDMLDCVTAAVRRVIEMGYADPDRIALLGGSFSGGGSAFIATQTDMFAAIVSRAAPINLAGEFNILFSGSGQNNHSYDIYGQGRYGTDPFDDFELYREQSPITHVANMNTPLLYLHGKLDPSVEYLQGMEFYNALRFLGKPIIFLSYPDEGHNLRRYENQLDFTTRKWKFLDHHLKGAPASEWMTKGVRFLDRGY